MSEPPPLRLPHPSCRALSCPGLGCMPVPEHELHGLTRLHRFYIDRGAFECGEVPRRPWLASLRFLAAHVWDVMRSVSVLAGATALTRLTLVDWPDNDYEAGTPQRADVAAFYEWAQAHPQLRCLTFFTSGCNLVAADIFSGALALEAARPELQVDAYPSGCDPELATFLYSGLDDLAPGWRTAIALTVPHQYY